MNEPARPRWLAARLSAQRRFVVGAVLFAIGAFFALGWTVLSGAWMPRVCHMNMLVDLNPNRALLAEKIAAAGKAHGVVVELLGRPVGSLEAIELLDTPNPTDVALVSGGVTRRSYPNVRQVLALGVESLHLLVRADLAEAGLAGLRGRRINLGPSSCGSHHIARDVLAFAGLRAPVGLGALGKRDYIAEESSPQELERRLASFREATGHDRDRAARALPDAVFLLSMLPSALARELVSTAGYRLLPLPFTDAYCLDRTRALEQGGARIDRTQLFAAEIPAYLYGIDPPIPRAPCRTIATRLTLVAYVETDPLAVSRLAETVYDGAVASMADPVPLHDQVPRFPFHHGTLLYRRHSQSIFGPEPPINPGALAGALGAFALGIVVCYCFLRFRQLRRFESYYHEVRRVEMVARGREADPLAPTDPVARRRYLDDKLLALKSKVFRDFAEGNLRGESLLSGIISLLNDTRNSLQRLSSLDEFAPANAPAEEKPTSGKPAPVDPN
jgi:hypothetical protein